MLCGMTIDGKLTHLRNVPRPMYDKVDGIDTETNDIQLSNT